MPPSDPPSTPEARIEYGVGKINYQIDGHKKKRDQNQITHHDGPIERGDRVTLRVGRSDEETYAWDVSPVNR
jgi:hypothetical protein